MARNGTAGADDALVIQLAAGASIPEAARACKVSVRTVKRRLEDEAFNARIAEARLAFTDRALARLLSLRLKHVDYLDKLAKPPTAKRKGENGTVRLGASKAVLEIGSKLRVETEFDARLRAIEERLAQQGVSP